MKIFTPGRHAELVSASNKKGFTLIELLVVVLIIGILAAVALPQYTAAVEKTRAMTLVSTLSSLAKAEEVFYLANGSYTSDLYALDIQPPSGGTLSGRRILFPDGSSIHLSTGERGYLAGGTRYVQIDIVFEHSLGGLGSSIYCYGKADDPASLKICQTMGQDTGMLDKCGMLPGTPACRRFKIN